MSESYCHVVVMSVGQYCARRVYRTQFTVDHCESQDHLSQWSVTGHGPSEHRYSSCGCVRWFAHVVPRQFPPFPFKLLVSTFEPARDDSDETLAGMSSDLADLGRKFSNSSEMEKGEGTVSFCIIHADGPSATVESRATRARRVVGCTSLVIHANPARGTIKAAAPCCCGPA